MILAGAKKAILEGNSVEVVKTLKANGENAQISWSPDAKCWVIASKNVAMLAEDVTNLELKEYQKKRYDYALLIAREWFSILSKLSLEQLKDLKHDLSGFTLVGEYVGNPDF